jgi:hypothetical protein
VKALTIDFQPVLDAADLMRRADKDVQKEMRRVLTREVTPWLRSAIRRAGTSPQDRRIAGTARIRSGANPAVVVGGSGAFSGGVKVRELVRQYEFGGDRGWREPEYRATSRRGRAYKVRNRRTQRQIPSSSKSGRMVYPAVADAAPMLVSAWLGVIYGTWREAVDGG